MTILGNSNVNERRANKRLELALVIKLLDHEAMSRNISPDGAYLEVSTHNVAKFSAGKMIEIEVATLVSEIGLPGRLVRLYTKGDIVRTDIISNNEHEKKLGVALKFNEKLKLKLDESHIND